MYNCTYIVHPVFSWAMGSDQTYRTNKSQMNSVCFQFQLAQISKDIHSLSAEFHNGTLLTWNDVCFQIPNIAELTVDDAKRRRRSIDHTNENTLEATFVNRTVNVNSTQIVRHGRPISKPDIRPFEPSVDAPSFLFCSVVDKLPLGCLMNNLLELWDFDAEKLDTLTKDDVLDQIARTNISATTGHERAFDRLLGGIKRNSTGHIVSATGLLSHWMVYINFSNVNHDEIGNAAGTEDWASEEALVWENEFLNVMQSLRDDLADDHTEIYYSAGRRYASVRFSQSKLYKLHLKLMVFSLFFFFCVVTETLVRPQCFKI